MIVAWLETFFASLPNFIYELVWVSCGFIVAIVYTAWRTYKTRRAFFTGQLREEVIVVGNVVEEVAHGVWYLKPRTVQSAQSLLSAFPNPVLVRAIIAATKKCNTKSPRGAFIQLRDAATHHVFMKRVVDLASEIGAVGHVARMSGVPVSVEEFYVCATYAADGAHFKIRIDLIAEATLRKFLDQAFAAALSHRPEEGSHTDLAAIFTLCAKEVFEKKTTDRELVRRVSIPIVL